ncbi:MAG: hypothetical protein LBR69_00980 [Endomicrobium sp.]|jgi:hypothetical protein|nr:hypothetical protein [Endomicrobium sp.]
MKPAILSFLCMFAFVCAFAAVPKWVSTGNYADYPKDTFIAVTGSGASREEAEASAKKAVTDEIFEFVKKAGVKIYKTDDIGGFILKYYSTALSYNDKGGSGFYVLGTVNKNLIRMDIEKEILSVEGNTIHNLRVLEESVSKTIKKIKEIDGVLSQYRREDIMILIKQYLKGEPPVLEPLSLERERLESQRKELFKKVSYVFKGDGFKDARIKKFFSDNGLLMLPSAPDENQGKDIITVNCKKSVSKADSEAGFKYVWTAGVIFEDAYNPDTVIYSDTLSGEESSEIENAAKDSADLSADAWLNGVIRGFLETVL